MPPRLVSMGRQQDSRDTYQRSRTPKTMEAKLATAKKAEARKKVAKVVVQGLLRGATDGSRRFMQAFVQPRQPVVPLDHLLAPSASPFTASDDHDEEDGPNDDDDDSDFDPDAEYDSENESDFDEYEPRRYNQEIEDALGRLLNMNDIENKTKIKKSLRSTHCWLYLPPTPIANLPPITILLLSMQYSSIHDRYTITR
jgi:hypothetical protein